MKVYMVHMCELLKLRAKRQRRAKLVVAVSTMRIRVVHSETLP
jgi:hypothetical protein